MSVKVSVIIPVYNVEKYLQDCIDSLINQTLQEIEFIFVNDASPDNCLAILLNNEKKYPDKIRVIDSKVNLKQGGARNLGIKAAKGEYIGFVDSDDVIDSDMFEKLYNKVKKKDLDVAYVKYKIVDENFKLENKTRLRSGNEIYWSKKLLSLDSKKLDVDSRMYMIAIPVGGVVCGLWRKKLIINNRLYFPENIKYEDNFWEAKMMVYLEKVGFIDECKYFYRYNPTSIVNLKNASWISDRLIIEDKILEWFVRELLYEKYKNALEYIFTFRRTFNTYYILINYDEINDLKIKELFYDLKEKFPNWYSNRYYKEFTSYRKRFIEYLIFKFPVYFMYVMKNKQRLKKIIKRIINGIFL